MEGEICCAGFCRAIECCIDEPDPNARCEGGTTCNEGQCVPAETPCSGDTGCGEGVICCANVCRAIECCIDDADPNARCPEGTSCFEGVCDPIVDGGTDGKPQAPVVQLPSTGTGPASGGKAPMLSAILTGGAAMAVALGGRTLRRRRGDGEAPDH